MPQRPEVSPRSLNPPPQFAAAEVIANGQTLYTETCVMCDETIFGNRGLFPDLRYSPMLNSQAAFNNIVLAGALQENGMRSFADVLSAEDAVAIRAYLVDRALQAQAANN